MNILLVDDDATSREALAEMLRRSGCNVEEAVDGGDGWSSFDPDWVDMVITDQNMSHMNGDEMIAEIRREGHLIPIIAMSGNADNMKRMMDAGANAFLLKPIKFDDLLMCITLQAGKAREEKA